MTRSPATAGSGRTDALVALVALLAFASVPLWADKGLQFLAAVVMINAVFALGFNVIFGLTGLVSFGHAAFFTVGAYAAGLLLQRSTAVPFLATLALAAVAGGLLAALVAVVALRRASGVYFAILTLALAELVRVLIAKSTFLGREDGLTGIKRPVVHLGIVDLDLAAGYNLYYATLVLVALAVAVLWMLWHNQLGRLLAAIRQDPERVRFLGVNVHAVRFWAFVISGAAGGFAGGLYAPVSQLLTPELAHWSHSALPILYCLVGGVAYFWGPVVGVVVFIGLEHATRNITGLSEVVIGFVLLVVVLAFPGGLIGGLKQLRRAGPKRGAPMPAEPARADVGGAT